MAGRKRRGNQVVDEPRQGWAYFEETNQWRRTPEAWGAPKDHFPKEFGGWFSVSKPLDWRPPAGTWAGESLLDGGAGLRPMEAGGDHTKIGAGHKPQGYDTRGRYTGPRGGSVSLGDGTISLFQQDEEKPGAENVDDEDARELEGVLVADSGQGTDNEAWRLKEKQFTPE